MTSSAACCTGSPYHLAHELDSAPLETDVDALQMQSAGVEMTFLSDVVSVAFVSDLITWSTRDAILSQLTDPAMGVYLCGAPLPERQFATGHVQCAPLYIVTYACTVCQIWA
jgi:hypothetical protein